jgi:hypothetical protein
MAKLLYLTAGVSRFQLLQRDNADAVYAVSDCLFHGKNLLQEPLCVRRALMKTAIDLRRTSVSNEIGLKMRTNVRFAAATAFRGVEEQCRKRTPLESSTKMREPQYMPAQIRAPSDRHQCTFALLWCSITTCRNVVRLFSNSVGRAK